MKKSIILVALFSVVALLSTSCQKNKKQYLLTFDAELVDQQWSKSEFDAYGNMGWTSADSVSVFDAQGGSGDYLAVPNPSRPSVAQLVAQESTVAEGDGPYTAIFPASIALSATSVELPVVQYSPDGRLMDAPLCAVSDDAALQFKHMCGVLLVRLWQEGVSVKQLKVVGDHPTSGSFTLRIKSGQPTLTYNGNGYKTTSLVCSTPQSISEHVHDFYLALPAGDYANMKLVVVDAEGRSCTKQLINVTIRTGRLSTVSVMGGMQFELQSGLFSVSPQLQVVIAKGNLQYLAATNTWRFAEKPWMICDYPGDRIPLAPTAEWFDLFAFGANGHDLVPWSLTGIDDPQLDETTDWGNNTISNDAQIRSWRTLSADEWKYLFFDRPRARRLLVKAQIADKDYTPVNGSTGVSKYRNGVILFPDDFDGNLPEGFTLQCSYNSTAYHSATDFDWDQQLSERNRVDPDNWAKLELLGAVFIPFAGYCEPTFAHPEVQYINSWWKYWTSDNRAFHWQADQDVPLASFPASPNTEARYPVRLCSNAIE